MWPNDKSNPLLSITAYCGSDRKGKAGLVKEKAISSNNAIYSKAKALFMNWHPSIFPHTSISFEW